MSNNIPPQFFANTNSISQSLSTENSSKQGNDQDISYVNTNNLQIAINKDHDSQRKLDNTTVKSTEITPYINSNKINSGALSIIDVLDRVEENNIDNVELYQLRSRLGFEKLSDLKNRVLTINDFCYFYETLGIDIENANRALGERNKKRKQDNLDESDKISLKKQKTTTLTTAEKLSNLKVDISAPLTIKRLLKDPNFSILAQNQPLTTLPLEIKRDIQKILQLDNQTNIPEIQSIFFNIIKKTLQTSRQPNIYTIGLFDIISHLLQKNIFSCEKFIGDFYRADLIDILFNEELIDCKFLGNISKKQKINTFYNNKYVTLNDLMYIFYLSMWQNQYDMKKISDKISLTYHTIKSVITGFKQLDPNLYAILLSYLILFQENALTKKNNISQNIEITGSSCQYLTRALYISDEINLIDRIFTSLDDDVKNLVLIAKEVKKRRDDDFVKYKP